MPAALALTLPAASTLGLGRSCSRGRILIRGLSWRRGGRPILSESGVQRQPQDNCE
jgi:hypothetical protein